MQSVGNDAIANVILADKFLITGILFLGHTFALGTETFIPRSQFDTKHLVSLFLELMFFVFSR